MRCRFVLNLILIVPVIGFALDTDSLLPDPGLPLDQTASLFNLDPSPIANLPDQEADGGASYTGGSIPTDESIFSSPSFDRGFGADSFDIADCSTSEYLPLPAVGKSRLRQRDDSKSCTNPSNTSPMTTNRGPLFDDIDDGDDFREDMAAYLGVGEGALVGLGLATYSQCSAASIYALPVDYCNTGTEKDAQYTGNHDFQFRGKFATWSLTHFHKGMLIAIFSSVRFFSSFFPIKCRGRGKMLEFRLMLGVRRDLLLGPKFPNFCIGQGFGDDNHVYCCPYFPVDPQVVDGCILLEDLQNDSKDNPHP